MPGLKLLCLTAILAFLALPVRAGESLVATHTIRAGSILTATDVALKEADIPGAARSAEEVIGLEARRNLYAGRPVLLSDLGPPTLVRRNDLVTVTYRYNGLLIQVEGRALEPGGMGEPVRVMNQASRTTLLAIITGLRSVGVAP